MLDRRAPYSYSAITKRPPSRWPNGKRLALYVAVGVESYAFGTGLSEDILPGASQPDDVNTSWRDYGNRVGGFRLLERLAAFGIPPTLLLNSDVYDAAPDLIDAARAAGAEMVAHGRSNSDTLATMSPAEEAAYIADVTSRILRHESRRPDGWSSPWLAHSPTTLDHLAGAGYRYLLDLRMDDQPVWMSTRQGQMLAIPYALELNDSTTMIGRYSGAQDFAAMIIDEFDEMLHASRDHALVMSVVLHSFISGQPFRLRALTRALTHIAAHRDDVWLTTAAGIAEAVTENPALAT
jgi:peptidoglycan/xylan/chitin deacetylase (PgdA/CDA1 family)